MTDKIPFSQVITVGPDGHFHLAEGESGKIAVEGSVQERDALAAIMDAMRTLGGSSIKEEHALMGAAVREPIRQLARYKQYTNGFFSDWPLAPTDDNRIPLDNPIGVAFQTAPDGRPEMITLGIQLWTRPSFFETKSGLRVPWNLLQTAAWPVLRRRMEETADDLQRRLDNKAKAIMDTAIATASGHAVTISGGSLTKAGLDSVLKSAAQIGFPITQAAINPSRLMDMTSWTQGSTSAIPFFFSDEASRGQVFRQLYADGYGNIRWLVSHSVPVNSIYLGGEPEEIGYHQNHGAAQSMSEVDIEEGVDKHVVRQNDAYYVGNAYNLWSITITA